MTAPSDLSRLTEILNKAGTEALAFFNGMAARQVVAKAPGDRFNTVSQLIESLERKQILERQPPLAVQVATPRHMPELSPLQSAVSGSDGRATRAALASRSDGEGRARKCDG